MCYHGLNRGNGQARVFPARRDYEDFETLMEKACEHLAMRVLAYCLMPTHFHLVLWPHGDGDMGKWMQRLLTSHVRRHHGRHDSSGHIWQGRFKAFPIQMDSHLLTVLRYVERNPLNSGLVLKAEQWEWSSLFARIHGKMGSVFSEWPLPRPAHWTAGVNEPQMGRELEDMRRCVAKDRPFGSRGWTIETARDLGLESSLRSRGRPRKKRGHSSFSS